MSGRVRLTKRSEDTKTINSTLRGLVEPQFLSLVKSPANMAGFKIIRSSDNKEDTTTTQHLDKKKKKVKRDDSLLSIDLPSGVSRDEAERIFRAFSLQDDYEIINTDEKYSFVRRGVDTEAGSIPVQLSQGVVANIDTKAITVRQDKDGSVALTGLVFDKRLHDLESVKRWCSDKNIDLSQDHIDCSGDAVAIKRSGYSDKGKQVKIDNGVLGVVISSDTMDVPEKIQRGIADAAYGNYGWGHLDFSAALADPEFSEKSWDAIWALQDVLENIIFYSGLGISERKERISIVLEQYRQFMDNMIDLLPDVDMSALEEVSGEESVSRSNNIDNEIIKPKKETDMKDKEVVKNSDKGPIINDSTTTEVETITRDDVVSIVKEVVTECLKEHVTRMDSGKKEMEEAVTGIALAIKQAADAQETIARSVKDLSSKVEELGDETVITGESAEGNDSKNESVKRADDNVYTGMFGSNFAV